MVTTLLELLKCCLFLFESPWDSLSVAWRPWEGTRSTTFLANPETSLWWSSKDFSSPSLDFIDNSICRPKATSKSSTHFPLAPTLSSQTTDHLFVGIFSYYSRGGARPHDKVTQTFQKGLMAGSRHHTQDLLCVVELNDVLTELE